MDPAVHRHIKLISAVIAFLMLPHQYLSDIIQSYLSCIFLLIKHPLYILGGALVPCLLCSKLILKRIDPRAEHKGCNDRRQRKHQDHRINPCDQKHCRHSRQSTACCPGQCIQTIHCLCQTLVECTRKPVVKIRLFILRQFNAHSFVNHLIEYVRIYSRCLLADIVRMPCRCQMNTDMSHTKQSHKTKQPHERLPIFNVGINHLQHQNKEKGHIYLFRAVLIKG